MSSTMYSVTYINPCRTCDRFKVLSRHRLAQIEPEETCSYIFIPTKITLSPLSETSLLNSDKK